MCGTNIVKTLVYVSFFQFHATNADLMANPLASEARGSISPVLATVSFSSAYIKPHYC